VTRGRSLSRLLSAPPRRGTRSDHGVSLVEFALILPVFALLLFGMIDFGIAFGDYLTLRSGVREGARKAAVNEISFTGTCRLNGTTVTPSTPEQKLACLTKSRIGISNQDDVRVAISVPAGANSGDTISICADVRLRSTTKITSPFLDGRRARSTTSIRMESAPIFGPFTETNGGAACS
jgi:Flp pilus assembly protein TadG